MLLAISVSGCYNKLYREDYLDKFQSLISEASYIDPYTIVVKFHYGLQTAIQNQIVTLLAERPKDTNSIACFEAVHNTRSTRLDKQMRSSNQPNRLFHSHPSTSKHWSSSVISTLRQLSSTALLPLQQLLLVLFPSIPMDINSVQKLHSIPAKGFYYCRDSNHVIYDYPVGLISDN